MRLSIWAGAQVRQPTVCCSSDKQCLDCITQVVVGKWWNLTAANQAVFTGRPERVAELRSLVSSGAYTPQTQKVGEKIVDQALSRPE
jgi:hypothetical protein